MFNEILVGEQRGLSDSGVTKARGGKSGDQIVSQLHGKFHEQASRGRAFFGVSASTGIAILVPATGGGHPTLFNPLGSGVDVSIIKLELSYVSGNHAPGAFEWAITKNAGAAAATGAAITAATLVASEPCLVGSGFTAKALWSPTTNTFTAAPVFLRPVGAGLHTGVAATAINPTVLVFRYDGDLAIAPGNALSLCYQTTTTTALFQVGITWEEIPL